MRQTLQANFLHSHRFLGSVTRNAGDTKDKLSGPVVPGIDYIILRINRSLGDVVVCFVNTYPLESNLSGG